MSCLISMRHLTMVSRSRFTDDHFIQATQIKTQVIISIRRKEELAAEILGEKYYARRHLILADAQEIRSRDLYKNYPPKFQNPNKRWIFDYLNSTKIYSPSEEKSLLISRWFPVTQFSSTPFPYDTRIVVEHNSFTYRPLAVHRTVEWYLNFANDILFGFYPGDLLAQDELQVLECPELAALREYLVQAKDSISDRTVGFDTNLNRKLPTPILISNVERVINLDTRKIYGNAFARASKEDLKEAFQLISPPQLVNLIAMEAPKYGHGFYTREQIEFILITAYTAFRAARISARKTRALKHHRNPHVSHSTTPLQTVIHTGWWGCGAYGNNRQMMILTQILAARWARIDVLCFHVINADFDAEIRQAKEFAAALASVNNVTDVVEGIERLGLKWEVSNNT